jgi:hypothetical protein
LNINSEIGIRNAGKLTFYDKVSLGPAAGFSYPCAVGFFLSYFEILAARNTFQELLSKNVVCVFPVG